MSSESTIATAPPTAQIADLSPPASSPCPSHDTTKGRSVVDKLVLRLLYPASLRSPSDDAHLTPRPSLSSPTPLG